MKRSTWSLSTVLAIGFVAALAFADVRSALASGERADSLVTAADSLDVRATIIGFPMSVATDGAAVRPTRTGIRPLTSTIKACPGKRLITISLRFVGDERFRRFTLDSSDIVLLTEKAESIPPVDCWADLGKGKKLSLIGFFGDRLAPPVKVPVVVTFEVQIQQAKRLRLCVAGMTTKELGQLSLLAGVRWPETAHP